MKIVLQVFCTNLKIYGTTKIKLSKLLSSLLKVLLRIHLAPKREALSQKYKAEKQQQCNTTKAEVDKPNSHKWIGKSERCQFRINTSKNALLKERREDTKKDVREELEAPGVELEIMADTNISAEKKLIEIEDGNINDDETAGTSRRRINSLVAVVRNVMFKNFGKTTN
ncbi:hypothetical protein INT47_003586 [Mucor saturninus]|uniref:Uncharacterized protein n=1 Tax=Mucor saturninus TaxID=64648 RepID=A0A8H7USR0_9FUNG|nr:hypothetical protein INT47_003586 [Mucor saturninus]